MLVTVYITTYNRKELLKRAIDSVLKQSYKDIEIIVADDGSTDGTHDYLQAQQSKGVLTALINDSGTSKGACYGRNKAIKIAKGIFVTGLDDDDYFEPWRIDTFVSRWKNSDVALFSGLFDSVVEHRKYGRVDCYNTHIVKYKDLRIANFVGNQVFTLTDNLREIDGFDEQMPALQDWDTWLRLSKAKGDIINVNSRSYVQFHDHGGSRISEKPAAIIRFAFDRLKGKLSPLTLFEESNILFTMYGYHQMDVRRNELWKLFLGGHFRRIAQVAKRAIKKR